MTTHAPHRLSPTPAHPDSHRHRPEGAHPMVTRKALALLTGITLALFAIAGIIGNHQHGTLRVIANIAWWGFVLGVLILLSASVATIVHHRKRARNS